MTHEHDCDCGTGRREFMKGCGAAMAFALAGTSMQTVAAQTDSGRAIQRLLEDAPKDWGRWGEDDELGRLNLLGSEEAFEGMNAATKRGKKGIQRFTLQLSQTGEVINPDPDQPGVVLGSEEGPNFPSTDTGDPAFPPRTPARRDNTTPVEPEPSAGGVKFVDDKWATDFFLQGTTHLDALGHAWYGDRIYNGFSARTTETVKEFDTPLDGTAGEDAVPGNEGSDDGEPDGCLDPVERTRGLSRAGIGNVGGEGLAGRAVLLDVGRQFGTEGPNNDWLPLGEGVTFEDLQETADAQGTKIRDRDLLLIRTGSIERTRNSDAEWAPLNEPGLVYSEELVEWVADRDIPYIGADTLAVEKVVQQTEEGTIVIPLHGALLRNLGVYLNEILDLSELAAACAEDGIYEFLFTAAPLNVERGSGAPVNPVVLKASGPDEGGGGNTGRGRGSGR